MKKSFIIILILIRIRPVISIRNDIKIADYYYWLKMNLEKCCCKFKTSKNTIYWYRKERLVNIKHIGFKICLIKTWKGILEKVAQS